MKKRKNKTCSKCKASKLVSAFYIDNRRKDKLTCWCKECLQVRELEYMQRPGVKERRAKYDAKYREILKEKYKDPKLLAERKKKGREYYKKNKKRIIENVKRYNQKPETKKKRNRRMVVAKRDNIQLMLNDSIGGAIRYSIRNKKAGRPWEKILGYTYANLVAHLESKFTSKMNWKNYGSYWHVDHIKPLSLFVFSSYNDAHFKKCWSLKNLQPLEAKENIEKGNKYNKKGN